MTICGLVGFWFWQQIPREFCWNSDGVVPQQCRLETMSGSWNVDVKRIGREIFLEEGWEEFVVGNSLKLGEYVTLHYYGHAKFFVEIYGHNHCERSKASKTDRFLEDEDEDDVIIIDSDSDSDDVLMWF
ncbi:PREDICTED: B3 domain-containing protein REM21-like [Fragaria vesca subsp. vesca]